VKNRRWLNIAEYLLLVGSGVGTVATVATQQILYLAAPVSALFVVNLVNRNRLEELTQTTTATSVNQVERKIAGEFDSLQKQVQAQPSFLDLASLKKSVVNTTQESVAELSRDIALLKKEIGKPEWRIMQQVVHQLQEKYTGLSNSVESVTSQLNRLNVTSKVEGVERDLTHLRSELTQLRVTLDSLSDEQKSHNPRQLQDQINHLNRRLNQLPPPFDATALKQDVNSLVKVVGEMASRRELSRLVAQIEKLTQQNSSLEQSIAPLRVATTILRKQLDTISSRLTATDAAINQPLTTALTGTNPQVIDDLRATVTTLEQRLNQVTTGNDAPPLQVQLQGIATAHLGQLQEQLASVQQMTQTLDRQQQDLRDWVNRLPQILDATALQSQMKELAARVEAAEANGVSVQTVQAQVEAAIDQRLGVVMQQLQSSRPVPEYELVFDVKSPRLHHAANGCGSRAMLEQALGQAQARLIIVYPYPTSETLNADVIEQFRQFLDRSGCLDLGWGHLGDVSQGHAPRSIDRRRAIDPVEKGFLYDTLNQLTQLKKQYPDQFRFKVLGTDENFLVCDRGYAILGSQSISTASAVFPQAAVGLRTTDPEVIQELVARFDDPVLDEHDVAAYLNRAITRYDLGDQQGAIADYTEVLRIAPDHDVAYNNRGLVYYDLGNREAAIADFEQAIQQNSHSYIAYCNRGFVKSELGDKLGAIEDYSFALHINPDYSTAYFYRGLARTRMQNKLGAIQDYSEVIRLNPQDATAYFYRGLAGIKIGQRADAIKDLRRAAQLFSDRGDVANYQQTVRTIEKLQKNLTIPGSNQPLVSNGV
jgi:tetratricopeptide (TPR) repeat protein